MTETKLSRATFERLQGELQELTTVGRVKIAQVIEAARLLGDLSENADYHAAKDDQGRMEGRIRQLEAMLEKVEIVEDTTSMSTDVVKVGTILDLRYEGDDEPERFLIGSIEERPEGVGVISPDSPLGRALLENHKLGDTVTFEAPSGVLRVEIVSIGA